MEMRMHGIKQEQKRNTGSLQIPLDEDRNISDVKPDAKKIIFYQGKVQLDEVKNGNNKVWVKGKLLFKILYQTEQANVPLDGMQGEIPFMEEMNVSFDEDDQICIEGKVDSFKVHIINSRKFSMQSVITLIANVYDQEELQISNDMEEKDGMEFQMKEISYLESAIMKKDVYRIHEEQTLPSEYEAMDEMIWSNMTLRNMSYRPLNDKISIAGEMSIFLVMVGEDQKEYFYETTIPISGILDCIGCKENMILRVQDNIQDVDIQLKEDRDGEKRQLHAEFALNLCIRLFENKTREILEDMYGTEFEVELETQKNAIIQLREEAKMEERIQEAIRLEGEKPFTILHFEPSVSWYKTDLTAESCSMQGEIKYMLLYQDAIGYDFKEGVLPFSIKKDIPMKEAGMVEANCKIVQQSITLQDQEAVCNLLLKMEYLITQKAEHDMILKATIAPFKKETLQAIPGIGVYYVSGQDTLWKIGKEYHISVDKIKKINELTKDEISPKDVLIIAQAK